MYSEDPWKSALSSDGLPTGEPWDGGGGFSGDFYNVPDNVVRGIALGAADVPNFGGLDGFGDFGDAKGKGGFLDFEKDIEFEPLSSGKYAGHYAPAPARFEEDDPTPAMPADPYYKLEATTLFAVGGSSAAIGNAVLEFLGTKVVASVTKVNRKKCCVKADLFVDGSMCTMKTRVYAQPGGRFAIEFQRRSGSAVVFSEFYRQAAEFMRPLCAGLPEPDRHTTGRVALSPPPLVPGGLNTDVSPLLDMAGMVESPLLQAEAAAALANIARDGEPTPLCNDRAFSEFKKLVLAESVDVAFPSAQLLKHLAQCPQAGHLFAESGIMSTMLARILQPTVVGLVQQELAQAVAASMAICASELPGPAADDLAGRLGEALASDKQLPGQIIQSLRAAATDLDLRRTR